MCVNSGNLGPTQTCTTLIVKVSEKSGNQIILGGFEMETRKNLLLVLGEWWEARRAPVSATSVTSPGRRWAGLRWLGKHLMSNLVSVLLVLVLLSVFPGIAAPNQAPSATSVSTIPYQGRLADASGNPITDKQNMEFRIYDVPAGGTPLWTESWTAENSVNVSDRRMGVLQR